MSSDADAAALVLDEGQQLVERPVAPKFEPTLLTLDSRKSEPHEHLVEIVRLPLGIEETQHVNPLLALDLEAGQEMEVELTRRLSQLVDPGDVVVLRNADQLDAALFRLPQICTSETLPSTRCLQIPPRFERWVEWSVHLEIGKQVSRARSGLDELLQLGCEAGGRCGERGHVLIVAPPAVVSPWLEEATDRSGGITAETSTSSVCCATVASSFFAIELKNGTAFKRAWIIGAPRSGGWLARPCSVLVTRNERTRLRRPSALEWRR